MSLPEIQSNFKLSWYMYIPSMERCPTCLVVKLDSMLVH